MDPSFSAEVELSALPHDEFVRDTARRLRR
jgi:hypothetical protein